MGLITFGEISDNADDGNPQRLTILQLVVNWERETTHGRNAWERAADGWQ